MGRLNTGLTGARNDETFKDLGALRTVDFQSKVMFLFINRFRYRKINTALRHPEKHELQANNSTANFYIAWRKSD